MDGGRDHFLAGARLACARLASDQDRHARARHELEMTQVRREPGRKRRKPRCRRAQLARVEQLGAGGGERLAIEQEAMPEFQERTIPERRARHASSVQPRAVLGSRVLDHPALEDALQPRLGRGHARVGGSDPHHGHSVFFAPLHREGLAAPDRHHVRIVKVEARTGLNGSVAAERQEEVRFPAARWRGSRDRTADGLRRLHSLHCTADRPLARSSRGASCRSRVLHLRGRSSDATLSASNAWLSRSLHSGSHVCDFYCLLIVRVAIAPSSTRMKLPSLASRAMKISNRSPPENVIVPVQSESRVYVALTFRLGEITPPRL